LQAPFDAPPPPPDTIVTTTTTTNIATISITTTMIATKTKTTITTTPMPWSQHNVTIIAPRPQSPQPQLPQPTLQPPQTVIQPPLSPSTTTTTSYNYCPTIEGLPNGFAAASYLRPNSKQASIHNNTTQQYKPNRLTRARTPADMLPPPHRLTAPSPSASAAGQPADGHGAVAAAVGAA